MNVPSLLLCGAAGALLVLSACAAPAECCAAQSAEAPAPAPIAPPELPPAAFAARAPTEGVPAAEQREGRTLGGHFHIQWRPEPEPLPFNAPFRLLVSVVNADEAGTPLTGETRLEVTALMPDHGHGMHRTPRTTRRADGSFLVEGMLFHMRGHWDLVFNVWSDGRYDQAIFRAELP